jgi:hypothetical protein
MPTWGNMINSKQQHKGRMRKLQDTKQHILFAAITLVRSEVSSEPTNWGVSIGRKLNNDYVGFEVFATVTMKNVVFWDINTQFILHRRHITSLLQRPAR